VLAVALAKNTLAVIALPVVLVQTNPITIVVVAEGTVYAPMSVAVAPMFREVFRVKVFAICYPKAIANAAASSMVATLAPLIFIEVVAVILLALTLAVVVTFAVKLIALITLPLKLNPTAFKLPPVILPTAEIKPGVVMLPPAMFEVTVKFDTTFELKLKPAAFKLPPVMLPLALKLAKLNEPVSAKLPALMLPATVMPVVVKIATLLTPPIEMLEFPPGVCISIDDVPLNNLSPEMLPDNVAFPLTDKLPLIKTVAVLGLGPSKVTRPVESRV
jgi:hypothetical protein